MNKWKKTGLAVTASAAVISTAHIINQMIFSSSVVKNLTNKETRSTYKWKFGNISYTISGEGSPILLIHDLKSSCSLCEWDRIIKSLGRNHTVYAIDLLGCGHSDKPNITYTTYMYTQMIQDFVINVIHKKTDIIAQGDSAPMAIMTVYSNPYIFNKLILVSPQDIKSALKTPDKMCEIRRYLLNSPVLGTLIYNICMSRQKLNSGFVLKYFNNKNSISQNLIDTYSENAHLGGSNAKYLFTSTECHYTTVSISKAVSKIDNSIYIINGSCDTTAIESAKLYKSLNPAIESVTIENAKHYPQIEQPLKFIKNIDIFLSSGFLIFYLIGSFEGSPDFLGYFLGVILFFFINTNERPKSVPGRLNL